MTKRIYWDKGHGGADPGAMGNGLREKNLTDKIIDYATAYMAANYTGFEQKANRPDDETLTLDERTNDANKWGADVLISVHINSATNRAANGFESHIYTDPGAATIALQNVVHAEIMGVMKAYGVNNDRGKKRSNFHMLRESKMVALLTENLFIVNVIDASKLKNEAFLKAVGEAHARGVAKYLGLPVKPRETPKEAVKLYYIKTGSFKDKEQAEKIADEIKTKYGFIVHVMEV